MAKDGKGPVKAKGGPITVTLGFDMETDVGSWSREYRGLREGTPKILKMLRSLEIKGTFLFTGGAAKASPEILHRVLEEGHEVGCHTLRHETIGEELFPLPGLDPVPERIIQLSLEIATEAVEKTSGVRPVSFRAPRLFGSTEMVCSLERLGYLTDATYPTYFFMEHLLPYHPSPRDWTKKGNMKILELPNFADITMKKVRDPYGRDRDQWPKFRTVGAQALTRRIEKVVKWMLKEKDEAFLCFYFHPWEFVKMPSKIKTPEAIVTLGEFIYKNTGEVALRELRKVLEGLLQMGATFLPMKDCAERW